MLGALVMAVLDTAHAGVWVQGPGEAWLQGSVSASTSSSLHDADGARTSVSDPSLFGNAGVLFDGGRYLGVDVAAYGEVGLGHGVEVVASLPGRFATQRWSWAVGAQPPIVQRNVGLGDLSAGARVGTTTPKGLALSLYGGGRAPLYDNHPRALRTAPANADFYDDRVPLGQGTLEAEALGGIGTGTGPLHGWALFEGGVRIRNRGYSTALPARAQLGVKTGPFDAWLGADATVSLGDGDAPDDFLDAWGKGPLVVDNPSWLTLELGALVPLSDRWSVVASASQVVAGRRWAVLTRGSLGLAWSGPLRERSP